MGKTIINRNNVALFISGLICYAFCEIVPLTSAIFVWQIYGELDPTSISGTPFANFSYMVQFDKPALMLFSIPALFIFFLTFSYIKVPRYYLVLLQSLTTFGVIAAIPDWIWYVGSPYYEILKYYSGLLSLFLMFAATIMYLEAWLFWGPESSKIVKS